MLATFHVICQHIAMTSGSESQDTGPPNARALLDQTRANLVEARLSYIYNWHNAQDINETIAPEVDYYLGAVRQTSESLDPSSQVSAKAQQAFILHEQQLRMDPILQKVTERPPIKKTISRMASAVGIFVAGDYVAKYTGLQPLYYPLATTAGTVQFGRGILYAGGTKVDMHIQTEASEEVPAADVIAIQTKIENQAIADNLRGRIRRQRRMIAGIAIAELALDYFLL